MQLKILSLNCIKKCFYTVRVTADSSHIELNDIMQYLSSVDIVFYNFTSLLYKYADFLCFFKTLVHRYHIAASQEIAEH